jgi:hypothetical protein
MKRSISRYRQENGQPCIDVRIDSIGQLFDNRDPAPFRERDLDPGLASYLRESSEEIGGRDFRIVFWLDRIPPSGEIENALRSYFDNELDRLRRRSRQRRITGQIALVIAVVLLVTLLSLAHLCRDIVPGALGVGLREGIVIAAWVVMWRPVEVLVYDWIPDWHERKIISRLLEAPIDVREGKGPGGSSTAEPT